GAGFGGGLKTIIPNVTKFDGRFLVNSIIADKNKDPKEALRIRPDSVVEIRTEYPNAYPEAFLRFGKQRSAAIRLRKDNDSGPLYFDLSQYKSITGSISEGEIVWVELRSQQPQLSGLISYYLTFFKETKQQEEKRKRDAEEAQKMAAAAQV